MIGNGLKLEEAGGPFWFYQMLPYFSQAWHKPLVDLVWSTKRYHSPDLGRTFWSAAFTNTYHRGD